MKIRGNSSFIKLTVCLENVPRISDYVVYLISSFMDAFRRKVLNDVVIGVPITFVEVLVSMCGSLNGELKFNSFKGIELN